MHYIDTSTAVGGLFVDPAVGQPPTVVDAAWANAVQLELLNVIQHAGISPTKGVNTQLRDAILALQGPAPSQGKNPLVNPSFQVAQKGDGPFVFNSGAGPVKLIDGWWFSRATSGAIEAERVAFDPGDTDVPGNPSHYLRWESTATGSGIFRLASRLESVRTFQGQLVTVSGWIKNLLLTEGPQVVTPRITQYFGSGGSGQNVVALTPFTVDTPEWTYFTSTVELPLLTGETISGGDDYLDVGWEISGDSLFELAVADLQIEAGNVATSFDRSAPRDTLLRCLRYYEASQLGLPVDYPTNIGGLDDQKASAIFAYGRGFDLGGGTEYGLPACSRQFLVPKRFYAVNDPAQHSFLWYPVLGNGAAGTIDLNATQRAVTSHIGLSRYNTGYPATATNPGGAVEICAHYAFEDLVF